MPSDWRRYVRLQDLVWLLLFAALAIFSPGESPAVIPLLIAIGAVQVFEPRIGARNAITITLLLCYPLIYFSKPVPYGVNSSFWMMLLLPVISAATNFGLLGSTIVVVTACLEDLSFLLFLWWENHYHGEDYVILPDDRLELALRILSLLVVSYLTHQLAKGKREEATKYQKAAEQLAAANQSLKEAEAQGAAIGTAGRAGTIDRRPGA